MKRFPLLAAILGAFLCVGLLFPAVAAPARGIGQVFHEVPGAPGELESRGAVVADGDVVRSVNLPALIRLANGHVLKLSANSSVWIESTGPGEVRVSVLSGRVLTLGRGDRVHGAGRGSMFYRSPTSVDALAAERQLMALSPAEEVARAGVDRD